MFATQTKALQRDQELERPYAALPRFCLSTRPAKEADANEAKLKKQYIAAIRKMYQKPELSYFVHEVYSMILQEIDRYMQIQLKMQRQAIGMMHLLEFSAPMEQCRGNAEDEPLTEDRSHFLVLQSTSFPCGCNGQGPLRQLSQTFPAWQFESVCGIWFCRTIPHAHLLYKTVHIRCEEQIGASLGTGEIRGYACPLLQQDLMLQIIDEKIQRLPRALDCQDSYFDDMSSQRSTGF